MKAKLLAQAREAQKNSYSPYSHCSVGASVLLKNGQIYSGCNVENASFGGTVCAERVAIFKAVSEEGSIEIAEICILSPTQIKGEAWSPCGLCRQVLQEFSTPKTKVHLAAQNKIKKTLTFGQLFPLGFARKALPKKR